MSWMSSPHTSTPQTGHTGGYKTLRVTFLQKALFMTDETRTLADGSRGRNQHCLGSPCDTDLTTSSEVRDSRLKTSHYHSNGLILNFLFCFKKLRKYKLLGGF